MKGRKFVEGKVKLQGLLAKFGSNGWMYRDGAVILF
jgi:hypothetical protein